MGISNRACFQQQDRRFTQKSGNKTLGGISIDLQTALRMPVLYGQTQRESETEMEGRGVGVQNSERFMTWRVTKVSACGRQDDRPASESDPPR